MGEDSATSPLDPRAQGVADAAVERDPSGPAADTWTDAEWDAYFKAYWEHRHGMQPARAPAAWPIELALIGAKTVMGAELRRTRRWPLLLACAWGLQRVTARAEEDRARHLGLKSASDQPRVPFRLRIPPAGRHPPVFIPIAPVTATRLLPILPLMALAIGRVLYTRRRGHRRTVAPERWEIALAGHLTREMLRRWDWRRAGGPTRPGS